MNEVLEKLAKGAEMANKSLIKGDYKPTSEFFDSLYNEIYKGYREELSKAEQIERHKSHLIAMNRYHDLKSRINLELSISRLLLGFVETMDVSLSDAMDYGKDNKERPAIGRKLDTRVEEIGRRLRVYQQLQDSMKRHEDKEEGK